MRISSPVFDHNGIIPSTYTCDGENISPPLTIEEVHRAAKSLVLIVDDPDAPNGTWVHWISWNIDPFIVSISGGSVPEGAVEGKTSFGKPGYGGPCPPSGRHRYFFKVYALDDVLDLGREADKAAVERAMEGHVLEKAELIGFYARD